MAKFTIKGFRAGSVCAGLRRGGSKQHDLALLISENDAVAAGTFTKNLVCAAPVTLSKSRIKSGSARAILVNAGCANAMTGPIGMKAAKETTAEVAKTLALEESSVLTASTGVIGVHLDVKAIKAAMHNLVKSVRPDGFEDVSRAIMTTDRVPKTVRLEFKVGAKKATILGLAKGAGMIAPDMATMLGFLFTDAAVSPELLKSALKDAVDMSFNRVRVDGDTSTNDCAFLLSGGASGITPFGATSPAAKTFRAALNEACFALAEAMARDGEGATKIMDLGVTGAKSDADAIKIGRTIADSPLVKTALHGGDPNWGRIAAAAGRSGVKIDPAKMTIHIGGIECVRGGIPTPNFDEKSAAREMRKDTVVVDVKVGSGKGSSRFVSSDLTAEYIRINAHYRT